jgi:hypothetical protein
MAIASTPNKQTVAASTNAAAVVTGLANPAISFLSDRDSPKKPAI